MNALEGRPPTPTDSLAGTARVVVELTDVNDNPPMFPSDTITFNVLENQPVLTQVGDVRADDMDTGVNQMVSSYQRYT